MKGNNGGFFDSNLWDCILEKVNHAMLGFLCAAVFAVLLVLIPSPSTIRIGLTIMCAIVFVSVFSGAISVILDIPLYVSETDGSKHRYEMYWTYIRRLTGLVLSEVSMFCCLLLHVYL